MTSSKLYYGPKLFLVNRITKDSKNIIYDSKHGLCRYSEQVGYLKNNIFTWKNPKSSYQIVEKEDYDIKIECRTLTGKRIHFKVSSVSYVSDIENKIFNMIGTPPDQQRLICGSIQLDKDDLCGNIFDQSDKEYKVNLICRLRGGLDQARSRQALLLTKLIRYSSSSAMTPSLIESNTASKRLRLSAKRATWSSI